MLIFVCLWPANTFVCSVISLDLLAVVFFHSEDQKWCFCIGLRPDLFSCFYFSFRRREVLAGLWWGGGGHEEERVSVARQRGRELSRHHSGLWRSVGGGDAHTHNQWPRGSCAGETHRGVHRGARWVTHTRLLKFRFFNTDVEIYRSLYQYIDIYISQGR